LHNENTPGNIDEKGINLDVEDLMFRYVLRTATSLREKGKGG
jgi:hypothetical protein